MKYSAAACLLLASGAHAFAPAPRGNAAITAVRMSEDSESAAGALVPVKQETVEFTAGLIGGVAGFAVGGPVLGALTAAAVNYASKLDGDVSDVVQTVSKSSIQVFNYLATLDSKYEILSKSKSSLEASLDKLKSQDNVDKATVAKVEGALASTQKKITEINDEYDLVGGATTALGVVGELVEKAVKKAAELNEEYQLTDKAMASLTGAVQKAKVAAKDVALKE
jgi:hypothetical protein